MKSVVDRIVAEIQARSSARTSPFLVALDGGSGAGKSTLAARIAGQMAAVIIPSDDFYAAHISAAEWDARSPAQKVADVIDWRRLRTEALEPLLAGKPARWHPFDFENQYSDGTYGIRSDFEVRQPVPVIVLDGAYSTRPELGDLIDLSVLIDVPIEIRHARLVSREAPEFLAGWHARWDAAEAHYFTYVRPKEAFDLVIALP